MGAINFNLEDCDKYDLVYLSLGAGLQSSVLYYMACIGWPGMPTIEYAAFADPGDEPQHTYETLQRLIDFGKSCDGPEIHIVSKDGTRMSDLIINKKGTRFASVPGFTLMPDGTVSMLRRQCTREYKIDPLITYSKRFIGVKKGERIGKRRILSLQGITTDEAQRMKPPRDVWNDSGYPLCTMRMNRHDCAVWLKSQGFKPIEKSACVYCPFHSDAEWSKIKSVREDWKLAVEVDEAIRDSTKAGVKHPVYLHRSAKPLKDVEFDDGNDIDLFGNECDGYCGL